MTHPDVSHQLRLAGMHHLVCRSCGRTEDVEVVFWGLCPTCYAVAAAPDDAASDDDDEKNSIHHEEARQ